jgi:hypothetical protein
MIIGKNKTPHRICSQKSRHASWLPWSSDCYALAQCAQHGAADLFWKDPEQLQHAHRNALARAHYSQEQVFRADIRVVSVRASSVKAK